MLSASIVSLTDAGLLDEQFDADLQESKAMLIANYPKDETSTPT